MQTEYLELIKKATKLAKPIEHNRGCTTAYVGCTLLTEQGQTFTGASIDADCGIGFCAEHSAIAKMTTDSQESKIKAIVAVSHNGNIIPPCGRCRELIYQINHENINSEIIVATDKTVTLDELLPQRWQDLY